MIENEPQPAVVRSFEKEKSLLLVLGISGLLLLLLFVSVRLKGNSDSKGVGQVGSVIFGTLLFGFLAFIVFVVWFVRGFKGRGV